MGAELPTILDGVVEDVRLAAPEVCRRAIDAAAKHEKPRPRKSDFEKFGIAVFTSDGELISAGNARISFPIQSISKLFALELALEAEGEALWTRVGREPSGDPFNSIVDMERNKGVPRNPLVNAGALVVCDILLGMRGPIGTTQHVVRLIERMLDGRRVDQHAEVMKSDRTGGDLNRALMFMAKHHGNLHHPVEKVMDAYIHQCAIMLDCRRLAQAGRFLMDDDSVADDDRDLKAARRARRILSIMMLCGQYGGSGDFAYRFGLPAKSEVGGGILAVSPHRATIGAWSPALDPMGNSWLATLGLELLTERTDWSIFGTVRPQRRSARESLTGR